MYEKKILQFHGKLFIPMRASDDVYSKHFLFKFCSKLYKLEAFRLYECGYGSYDHVSLEILYYKLNKHEEFHMYVFGGASLGRQFLKIFCYKLHKHKAFDLYVSGDASLGNFS